MTKRVDPLNRACDRQLKWRPTISNDAGCAISAHPKMDPPKRSK